MQITFLCCSYKQNISVISVLIEMLMSTTWIPRSLDHSVRLLCLNFFWVGIRVEESFISYVLWIFSEMVLRWVSSDPAFHIIKKTRIALAFSYTVAGHFNRNTCILARYSFSPCNGLPNQTRMLLGGVRKPEYRERRANLSSREPNQELCGEPQHHRAACSVFFTSSEICIAIHQCLMYRYSLELNQH